MVLWTTTLSLHDLLHQDNSSGSKEAIVSSSFLHHLNNLAIVIILLSTIVTSPCYCQQNNNSDDLFKFLQTCHLKPQSKSIILIYDNNTLPDDNDLPVTVKWAEEKTVNDKKQIWTLGQAIFSKDITSMRVPLLTDTKQKSFLTNDTAYIIIIETSAFLRGKTGGDEEWGNGNSSSPETLASSEIEISDDKSQVSKNLYIGWRMHTRTSKNPLVSRSGQCLQFKNNDHVIKYNVTFNYIEADNILVFYFILTIKALTGKDPKYANRTFVVSTLDRGLNGSPNNSICYPRDIKDNQTLVQYEVRLEEAYGDEVLKKTKWLKLKDWQVIVIDVGTLLILLLVLILVIVCTVRRCRKGKCRCCCCKTSSGGEDERRFHGGVAVPTVSNGKSGGGDGNSTPTTEIQVHRVDQIDTGRKYIDLKQQPAAAADIGNNENNYQEITM